MNEPELYVALCDASIVPEDVFNNDDKVEHGRIIAYQLAKAGFRVVPIVEPRGREKLLPVTSIDAETTPRTFILAYNKGFEDGKNSVPVSAIEPPAVEAIPIVTPIIADLTDPDIVTVKMHKKFWDNPNIGFRTKAGQNIAIDWGIPDSNGLHDPKFHASGTTEAERTAKEVKEATKNK